ncbi:MAG: response regulator [Candidatus Thiodiazotropha sp. (ex Lucinoma borealis)]|nr:response regulator [Candidatus Thiodiazotropha sp. (ex Lucinoma borealis)]
MTSTENSQQSEMPAELPELLASIEGNWPVLPSGIWNGSGIRSVLRHLQVLARKSKQTGLVNIYELSRTIDQMINDVFEENTQPDVEEIEKLNSLFSKLKQAIEASRPSKTFVPEDDVSYDVIYLHQHSGEEDQISRAIANNGWQVLNLTDSAALSVALESEKAKVVLIDTEYLQDMSVVPQVLNELRLLKKSRPELIFLSNQCDIEIRLEVLRTGATQCFSKPININDLMLSIKRIIAPGIKPHYRVLIVEDDESQAQFASSLLRKGELETLAITDPLNVMDAVQGFQPDLILMDLYMPGANGIELTQVIRERKESLTIPIVFLSGEDDLEKKLLALHSGADDFLTKPVRPQHLLATVKTRINRAKAIFSAGKKGLIDTSTGLHNRRELLQQLDMSCNEIQHTGSVCAVFSIVLSDQAFGHDSGQHKAKSTRVMDAADLLGALFSKRDFIARTGKQSLAILLQRPSKEAIESIGVKLYAQLSEGLDKGSATNDGRGLGIGLELIDSKPLGAYIYLKHAEISAMQALQQSYSGYIRYQKQATASPDNERKENTFQKEQFLNAIHTGLISIHEQRFTSSNDGDAEIREQIPLPEPATDIVLVANDIYLTVEQYGIGQAFDHYICKHAIHRLGEYSLDGNMTRLIIRLSAQAAKDESVLELIQSELRKLQVVGTGLMIEFNLPSLASDLKQARHFLGELSALGISTLLGNFACNDTAYKVLAYLKANAIRPHPSLLQADAATVQKIATHVHSLHAKIILPRVDEFGQISLNWSEAADYVQADYSD